MKTLSKILTLGLIISLFPFYGMAENSATHDEGVVINGVRWATRNVDAPGTFADNPEDFGGYFQWNKATTEWTVNWIGDDDTEKTWENDPCPDGWRIPTAKELDILINTRSTWRRKNGVNGRIFGRRNNTIFLPAGGWADKSGDNIYIFHIGNFGNYWSNSNHHRTSAIYMAFDRRKTFLFSAYNPHRKYNIRCVAK